MKISSLFQMSRIVFIWFFLSLWSWGWDRQISLLDRDNFGPSGGIFPPTLWKSAEKLAHLTTFGSSLSTSQWIKWKNRLSGPDTEEEKSAWSLGPGGFHGYSDFPAFPRPWVHRTWWWQVPFFRKFGCGECKPSLLGPSHGIRSIGRIL